MDAKLNVSKEIRDVIVSAISAGTFYTPQTIEGIECAHEDFPQYAGKTLAVNVLNVGTLVKSGRTQKVGANGSVVGTEFDTFRALVTLQSGQAGAIKVRLHLCDLLPLLASEAGEGTLTFGTYYPNGEKGEAREKEGVTRYLVPTSPMRYSADAIKEALTNNKISALVVNA
jgi:hypothetical protein